MNVFVVLVKDPGNTQKPVRIAQVYAVTATAEEARAKLGPNAFVEEWRVDFTNPTTEAPQRPA